MSSLTLVDRRSPLVKLGQQSGLELLNPLYDPLPLFLKPARDRFVDPLFVFFGQHRSIIEQELAETDSSRYLVCCSDREDMQCLKARAVPTSKWRTT